MTAVIDPSRCPLCGAANKCGMAASEVTCWCYDMTIPTDVLAKVPSEARDLACVCRSCATGTLNPEKIAAQINELLRRR